jgi:hypothetical protein
MGDLNHKKEVILDIVIQNSLTRHFEEMGASLKIETIPVQTPHGRRSTVITGPFELDIIEPKKRKVGEKFVLRVREDSPRLEPIILDVKKRDRHLVLLMRQEKENGKWDESRYLCGHDERHWFVAALIKPVNLVNEAKDSLKPEGILRLQHDLGVRKKQWNRRKNPAFQRQGEWFFVPMRGWIGRFDPLQVLENEPIRRSNRSKPHRVEFIFRQGGERVYVCDQQANGVSPEQYARLIQDNPQARRWNWREMKRNPKVYAKGWVRHADHATIFLRGWHQVLMNNEQLSSRVAFLD